MYAPPPGERAQVTTMNGFGISFVTSSPTYGKCEWNTFRIGDRCAYCLIPSFVILKRRSEMLFY